jgi:ribosomal protein L11 methyltransferase
MNDPSGQTSVLARLATDDPTARRLADALAEAFDAGETAVAAYGDDAGGWTVEIYFGRAPDQHAVRALLADLAGEEAGRRLAFATVAVRDWVAASLEGLPPVEAGRFFIHGSHHRSRVPPNRIGIEIEAALAFGTGHHATTRGCLKALDRLLKARRMRKILDVGTGTGVLAIAAARALRRPVLASDIDPVSVRVARDNARLNHVGAATAVIRANGLGDRRFRAPFDLVFGNILLGALKRLARPIGMLAAPGARVVVSGLLPSQANAALAAYRCQGLVLERRILLDGWATLVLARPSRYCGALRVRRDVFLGSRASRRHWPRRSKMRAGRPRSQGLAPPEDGNGRKITPRPRRPRSGAPPRPPARLRRC